MAGKDNVIGLAMGLDVADLKAGINEVKKIVKSSKDEFNLATAGLDKWTKSSEGLTAKLTQLNKQLDAQKKVVNGYKAEIERVSKLEGDHSQELENLKSKLTQAEIAVKKTESQINKYSNSLSQINAENKKAESSFGKLTREIEEQQAELSKLEFAYKDAVLTYGKNSKEAKALEKQISSLSGELQENQSKVAKSEKALKNLENQLDDTEEEAKDFGSALDGIKGLGGAVAKGVGVVGAAIGGLATAFLSTAESTRELRTNLGKVETAFATAGLSAQQATQTYADLYSVVADEGKATEATAHIAKLAKSQEDLSTWVNISTGVYATFGDSLPIEALAEASNETAKTGSITGALADALNWAGVSEEQFQAKLDGLSTEQERNQLITETLNGLYSEASKQYQETNKDVIASNKAQVELSNTMAELGAKAEPIMTSIKNGFNQILQAVIELLNGADFEAIKAGIENAFAYFIDTIIPAIVNGFQWIMNNKDILIAGIVAIGTAMLAWNVVTIVQGVVGAIKTWTTVTQGMTVAQTALNLVMAANPIGLVITAIAALVAGIIALWKNCDGFREFWINFWNKIKENTSISVKIIKEFFSNLWSDIKKNWGLAVDWFKNIGSKIAEGFKNATNKVKNYFSDSWEKSKQCWSVAGDWFADVGSKISKGFNATTEKMKNAFSKGWENTKKLWGVAGEWFSNIGSKIVNGFKSIPEKIKNFFTSAWNNVKSAWSNPAQFFNEVKDKIITTFKELPSRMLSVGKNLVQGLWNGIKDMTSWITDKLKGFGDSVLSGIKKFFGIHSPSTEMAEVGNYLVEGLGQGIEKNTKKAVKSTNQLGKEIMKSIGNIEKEIENSSINEKIVALGGKVKNPFEDWSNSKLNSEINELEKEYIAINDRLIENGVVQEQWGTSSEKMNERAKILEERLNVQNKLLDLFNAKVDQYKEGEVPDWVTEGISKYKDGIDTTIEETKELNSVFEELSIQFEETPKTFFESLADNLKLSESELEKWANGLGGTLSKIGDFAESVTSKMTEIGDTIKAAFDQHVKNQTEQLDYELDLFNETKDKELAKQEELFEQGVISEEELAAVKENIEKQKQQLEEETLKKKNALSRKQFNAQKANDIAQATIQGALAIVKGFAELGPIAGGINAGIQAGITATQIGTIASQKFIPMLAKGGVVNSATLAMIGEDGKEAVLPLENNTGWIRELAEKLNSVMQKDFSIRPAFNQLQPAYAGQPVVNNYYNQTINSPKQLNRREIYRDSKNLLSLKGV